MSVTEAWPARADVTPRMRTPDVARRKRTPPVVYWAAVGVLFIALQAYLYGAWIMSDDFERVSTGVSPVPNWMQIVAIVWQIVSVIGAIACIYWFVVRPKLRENRFTTDGFLCLAFLLMYWQDPLLNYNGVWFTYNAFYVNMGTWAGHMPGWNAPMSPGAAVPEPLIWVPAAYVFLLFGATVLMSKVMAKARERWPGIHPLGLLAICFSGVVVLDIIVEGFVWMPLGMYTYAGGHGVTNPSTFYKFPIEEALLLGASWVGWASLRYFKDDKGLTLAERGVDALRISERRKSLLRFLAIVGAVNAIYAVLFMIPSQWVGTHLADWPEDVQKRSYLNNHLCGEGTTRACPAGNIPNARGNDTLYVDPNGNAVIPPGVEQPQVVPLER